MLALLGAWQTGSAIWGVFILPLLKKIPWWVWVAVGLLVAFMAYGHYRENKGYAKCEVQTKIAADKEIARQKEIGNRQVQLAKSREKVLQQELDKTNQELDNAKKEAAQLKTAKQECLPDSVTRKLRRLR